MNLLLRLIPLACCGCALAAPIDREALVRRHNVVVRSVDPQSPLTVGNGGFAFTVDVTGLQTFGEHYYKNGIPLETLARWCWTTDENPNQVEPAKSGFVSGRPLDPDPASRADVVTELGANENAASGVRLPSA